MKMRPWQFLRFDAAGAALYAGAYIALGFVFREFLALITRSFIAASHLVEGVVLVAIAAYIIYRVWLYKKNAMYRVVPRMQVQELAQRLASDEDRKAAGGRRAQPRLLRSRSAAHQGIGAT